MEGVTYISARQKLRSRQFGHSCVDISDLSYLCNYSYWVQLLGRCCSTFFFYLCGRTLGTAATTGLLYQPRMVGDGYFGGIGGMKFGKGNRSSQRKPAPAPLCPPQIPHD
jgi:hypothetical protein